MSTFHYALPKRDRITFRARLPLWVGFTRLGRGGPIIGTYVRVGAHAFGMYRDPVVHYG